VIWILSAYGIGVAAEMARMIYAIEKLDCWGDFDDRGTAPLALLLWSMLWPSKLLGRILR
jgi:hypothetical protein